MILSKWRNVKTLCGELPWRVRASRYSFASNSETELQSQIAGSNPALLNFFGVTLRLPVANNVKGCLCADMHL